MADAPVVPVLGSEGSELDHVTLLSFLAVLTLLQGAYVLSTHALYKSTPTTLRILFIWHAFDFLIHLLFEGSYLYNCFHISVPFDSAVHHPSLINNFLKQPDRVFGSKYGSNWGSALWNVYAAADKRWAVADPTIISIELITVLIGAPLAIYICYGISRRQNDVAFWTIVLAVGEIYGG